MKPTWYSEVLPLLVGGDTGASGPVLRGRILSLLHGAFAQKEGSFAVAFPPVSTVPPTSPLSGALRVFASTRDDLDWLAERLSPLPWFRDYARLTYARQVPEDFDGPWACYRRFRVPSLASDRRQGAERGALRQRRMAEAETSGAVYFILQSATTRQRFSLIVQREETAPFSGDCCPNGYGFSVTTRPFSLPEVLWG